MLALKKTGLQFVFLAFFIFYQLEVRLTWLKWIDGRGICWSGIPVTLLSREDVHVRPKGVRFTSVLRAVPNIRGHSHRHLSCERLPAPLGGYHCRSPSW